MAIFWTGKSEQKVKGTGKNERLERRIREGEDINHKEKTGKHEKFRFQ